MKKESLIIETIIMIMVIIIIGISSSHLYRCYNYPEYMGLGILAVYLFFFIFTLLSIVKQFVNKKIDFFDFSFIFLYSIILFFNDITLIRNAVFIIVLSGLFLLTKVFLTSRDLRKRSSRSSASN